MFAIVVRGVVFAWCIGVYYCRAWCWLLSLSVLYIGYMLFNSLVLACSIVTLTLYHLATITALYRLYLSPWCIAGYILR